MDDVNRSKRLAADLTRDELSGLITGAVFKAAIGLAALSAILTLLLVMALGH